MIDNHSAKSILLASWMTVMPILFSSFSAIYIANNFELIKSFDSAQWGLFFIIVTITMGLALTPTTLVAICTGYFLGFKGLIPLVIAYSLASYLGYVIAQNFGKGITQNIIRRYPKADKVIEQLNGKSPYWFVALCRLSPVLPFGIMNVVLSFMGTPLKPFLLGGLVGMLPRTIAALTAGKLTYDLITLVDRPGQNQLIQISFLILIILSSFGLLYLLRRAINPAQ